MGIQQFKNNRQIKKKASIPEVSVRHEFTIINHLNIFNIKFIII